MARDCALRARPADAAVSGRNIEDHPGPPPASDAEVFVRSQCSRDRRGRAGEDLGRVPPATRSTSARRGGCGAWRVGSRPRRHRRADLRGPFDSRQPQLCAA